MTHEVERFKAGLRKFLEARNDVLAAWEGGSLATGFADEYSDLDLLIVTKGQISDIIFASLEALFSEKYGIERSFRMPEPTWHGLSQCFYLLKNLPPCFYCDIAVTPAETEDKLTAPDRHGNAVIWFDKAGIYNSAPTPPEEIKKLARRVFRMATATDFLGVIELQKSLARNDWIHSHMNWVIFVSRHLVPLLNLKHRPAKADFGIRYAGRDYPTEDAKRLEELLRVGSTGEIRGKSETAIAWFEELKAELAEHYGS